MALWDAADLLERCQRAADRPTTDESMAPADWYAFLTEAQFEWITHLASICPATQYGAPVQLVSADGGYTYDFPDDADGDPLFPMGQLEIRATRSGALLQPGNDWSDRGDYVPEGTRIRMPNGRSRTFPQGPWARYIAPPAAISASSAPTMQPKHARILLVYRACRKWASKGGLRDPQPFLDQESEAWYGAPAAGVTGILGMLKTQYAFEGMAAIADEAGDFPWWRSMNDQP